MIKYIGTVIESGLFEKINKTEYINVYEELNINMKKLSKGETVYREGDKINDINIIHRGSIRGEKLYVEGDLHIVDVFDSGQIFGLETAVSRTQLAPIDYISNEESLILGIGMDSIRKSKYGGLIMDVISEYMADEIIRKMHKIEILAEKSLRKRIITYLEILRAKAKSSPETAPDETCDKGKMITVKMNREQLASYLCVNRSALSNELNKMKREKIIDFDKENFRFL